MRRSIRVVLCASMLSMLVASSTGAAVERPVYSSIKELMGAIVDPSADVLWGAAGTVVDKDGVHDLAPTTPEGWLDVRRSAIRIIEGANLLMMPGRLAAPPGTRSDTPGVELEPREIDALIRKDRRAFDGFARALQGIGSEALRAIDAKDINALTDIGARMDGVCESCHQTFWYPGEKLPP